VERDEPTDRLVRHLEQLADVRLIAILGAIQLVAVRRPDGTVEYCARWMAR
jgi:hypothetical protein